MLVIKLHSLKPVHSVLDDHVCEISQSAPQHIIIDGWDSWEYVCHLNYHVGVN